MNRLKNDLITFIREFLQVVMDFFFYVIPQTTPSYLELSKTKIIAHRGWHNEEIKENTMESFQKALDEGLWGIEFDIRWTKDLVPVVHHDPGLKRVWNYERDVKNMSFNELRTICPDIPSLEEVVESFGRKVHLFIEIKEEHFRELEKQNEILKNILSDLAPEIDYHFLGLKRSLLEKFPICDLSTYFLVANFNISDISRSAYNWGCGGVMGHYLLCTDELMVKHRGAGQSVATGFSRTKNCMYREVHRGVEWVFTNHPWNLIGYLPKPTVNVSEENQ